MQSAVIKAENLVPMWVGHQYGYKTCLLFLFKCMGNCLEVASRIGCGNKVEDVITVRGPVAVTYTFPHFLVQAPHYPTVGAPNSVRVPIAAIFTPFEAKK